MLRVPLLVNVESGKKTSLIGGESYDVMDDVHVIKRSVSKELVCLPCKVIKRFKRFFRFQTLALTLTLTLTLG